MKIKVENFPSEKIICDVLFVGAYEDKKKPFESLLKDENFEAKKNDILAVNTQRKFPAKRICFLGLGKSSKAGADSIRNAVANGARLALGLKAKTVAVSIDLEDVSSEDISQAISEGLTLGSYKFGGYHKKESPKHHILNAIILVEEKSKLKAASSGAKWGQICADAENSARDLVNAPSNLVTPDYMAKYAQKMAKLVGLKCEILDPKKEGMECLWAVAKGSENPPKVVVLRHNGARGKGQELIAIIGKGITFDSGGISIKPAAKMWEMRGDMAGAAAVIEAMRAIATLNIQKNIVAVIPLAENMPDGRALKPGDVVGSLDGTTVEIISTDAEGRMILADAITYSKKLGADKIFDCATLTGGCVTALGDVASGLLGNNQDFIDEILEASERSGQKMWHLPLFPEYKEYLKSNIADLKNCMDRGMASASTGATFLHRFVGDTPWVHLDIAGTAFLSKTKGINSDGATGVPLRTILEWLRD